MNTIKEQLGIDFDDKGLAETIESVTNDYQRHAVYSAMGRAVLDNLWLSSDITLYMPRELFKDIAFHSDEVMDMLSYYASKSDEFMERL